MEKVYTENMDVSTFLHPDRTTLVLTAIFVALKLVGDTASAGLVAAVNPSAYAAMEEMMALDAFAVILLMELLVFYLFASIAVWYVEEHPR